MVVWSVLTLCVLIYKYLGCEVDEFLEMKLMLEQRVEAD